MKNNKIAREDVGIMSVFKNILTSWTSIHDPIDIKRTKAKILRTIITKFTDNELIEFIEEIEIQNQNLKFEEKMREKYPLVRDAHEQYILMMTLNLDKTDES